MVTFLSGIPVKMHNVHLIEKEKKMKSLWHAVEIGSSKNFFFYLTVIIRRMRGEYCRIIPETKSKGLFDNIHWAWGE